MSQILLDKRALELRMNMGWRKARRLLAKMGVLPIDVGEGQSKRLRWLESAVDTALLAMHEKAQPKKTRRKMRFMNVDVAAMSAAKLMGQIATLKTIQ